MSTQIGPTEEIPLKPVGREDIRKLESALLVMSLFSPETMEVIKNPHERLTWVDSLYVAAAALAREKAGMPVSRIAEEIGVTEATVRRHLRGETKAGQVVQKAYERLAKEGFKIELPEPVAAEIERLRREVETLRGRVRELQNELEAGAAAECEEIKAKLERTREALRQLLQQLEAGQQ